MSPAGYIMATVFWNQKGVILEKFLHRGPLVDSGPYTETLKPVTRPKIIEKAKSFMTK